MTSKIPLFIAGVVMTVSALLVGCAGSGTDILTPDRITADELIGTWAAQSIQLDERSVNCPATLALNDVIIDCGTNETFEFRADGTYVFSTVIDGQPGSQTGLWFLREDDTIELKTTGGELIHTYIISTSPNLADFNPFLNFNEIFGSTKTTKVLAKAF